MSCISLDNLLAEVGEYSGYKEKISKETGIPTSMMSVHFFYHLEPVEGQDDIFDPAELFRDSFSYEEYNPDKIYRKYQTTSTMMLRDKLSIAEWKYITTKTLFTYFYVAINKLAAIQYKIYVVTNEIFTKKDIDLLGKYCRCDLCMIPWYCVIDYISGKKYLDCIKDIKPNSIIKCNDILSDTRKYINEKIKVN